MHATLDEGDGRLSLLEGLGFVVQRRETTYLVPTDPHVTGLADVGPPDGIVLRCADGVDADRLRLLDDTLRQDVPGTGGWRWDAAAFREETFESADFDPALYVVAVDEWTDEYLGIARVWNRPGRPRLGFVGVARSRRRRGLARAMLAEIFAVLHARGLPEVSTEVDDTNVASRSLIESLAARPTAATLELVRRAR